ncbi:hypothetical protein ACO0R3_000644 [Hanseniaspora guilliermondii]
MQHNRAHHDDINVYGRLLQYIGYDEDTLDQNTTVISSNDKKFLTTKNKNNNLVSKLTSALIDIKNDTSSNNINQVFKHINQDILKLELSESIDSPTNKMILANIIPWDDSRLSLTIIESLFQHIRDLTGNAEYFKVFQYLRIKKLGMKRGFEEDEFMNLLQYKTFDILEALKMTLSDKGKKFWSMTLILSMKSLNMFNTLEEFDELIYWQSSSEKSLIDQLLNSFSKNDYKTFTENELIVYTKFMLMIKDYNTVIELIEKDILAKSGNINLYLKNIVVEACENIEDCGIIEKIYYSLLISLNDYQVLRKYVDFLIKQGKTKVEIVENYLNIKFEHFTNTRNFKLIKVYLDYKFFSKDHEFYYIDNYLKCYYNKPCVYPDLLNLVPKDILIEHLMKYESCPERDFTLYKLNGCNEMDLPTLKQSIDYKEHQLSQTLNEFDLKQIDESESTYKFKLLKMIHLNSLGMYSLAKKVYVALSIKNVQQAGLNYLLNDIIPNNQQCSDLDFSFDELENYGYVLTLTLQKGNYSKFQGLLKFMFDLGNSNVMMYKQLHFIQKQRFFGNNKNYRTQFINTVLSMLRFGISDTKDPSLSLPDELINRWDFSSDTEILWKNIYLEVLILKALDNGSLKYEYILSLIEQKFSHKSNINNILEWQIEFFREYGLIANDNAKVVDFLKAIDFNDVLENFECEDKIPYEILMRYIDVLKTIKTLSSIKKFQNNKSLKNEIKNVLTFVRSYCESFKNMYINQMNDVSLNDDMKIAMESNIKQLKML